MHDPHTVPQNSPLRTLSTWICGASIIGGLVALPWFVTTIGKEDCALVSNSPDFSSAEIGECVAIEGFVILENNEYLTLEEMSTDTVGLGLQH